MIVLRIITNALLMAFEFGAIFALAVLATRMPLLFAGVTAVAAFGLGAVLERARLLFELPFYVEGQVRIGRIVALPVALGSAIAKAVMVGFVALLTFSGTDLDRRFWIACAMALTIYAGVSGLRRLWLSFGVRAARWGYFRLAMPLGVLFAVAVATLTAAALIKQPTFAELIRQLVLETPAKPNIAQASELLFQLKLYIDGVILRLLTTLMPAEFAQLAGIVLSVNVLAGLVAAVWAVPIAELSLAIEKRTIGRA